MFLKFVFRTLVGALIALALGLATTGGDLIPSLVLVIVCTAGVALLVLLPLCYLIGLAATIAFVPWGATAWTYAEKRRQAETLARQLPLQGRHPDGADPLPRAERALLSYATAALARGEAVAAIHDQLARSGWSEPVIRKTLDLAAGSSPAATSTPPPIPGSAPD